MILKTIFHGVLIGIANIIPGVSGGTMAVVLGIYDKVITSISGFFSKSIKRDYFFYLFQIGLGAILGIFLFSNLISFFLEFYMQVTHFFFLALIIGSFPAVYTSHSNMNLDSKKIISFILGFLLVLSLWFFPTQTIVLQPGAALSIYLKLFLILSGAIATGAMVLPGISGSFILLLIGSYGLILSAVSELNFEVLMYVSVGAMLGLVLFSKLISWSLKRFPALTYYFIMGLMMASIFKIWPGFPSGIVVIQSVLSFVFGLALTYFLRKK